MVLVQELEVRLQAALLPEEYAGTGDGCGGNGRFPSGRVERDAVIRK